MGLLSSQTRLVTIKNVLTERHDTLEVPSEETLAQVGDGSGLMGWLGGVFEGQQAAHSQHT